MTSINFFLVVEEIETDDMPPLEGEAGAEDEDKARMEEVD